LSRDSFGEGPDDGTQEFCEPSQEQAEVVAGRGEDGVDAMCRISFFTYRTSGSTAGPSDLARQALLGWLALPPGQVNFRPLTRAATRYSALRHDRYAKGQTEKYAERADIFRSSADNRHPRWPFG